MSIVSTSVFDLKEKLGSHKFEIIEVGTEWCVPCKMMKKAMHSLLKSSKFNNEDLCIYCVDGDEASSLSSTIHIAKTLLERKTSFPVKEDAFAYLINEFIDEECPEEIKCEMIDSMMNGPVFSYDEKSNSVNINDIEKFVNILNPIDEYDVTGYPTLIFYYNGTPIKNSLDESDYESRGFERYDENEEYNGELSFMTVKENSEEIKYVRTKNLDCRIVGYDSKKISKILQSFIEKNGE